MAIEYGDRWITCDEEAIRIRGYYIPWGTKHIPYRSIRSVQPVRIAVLTGKLRLWGTSNPTLWASLDPRRVRKQRALILDLGRPVRPFLTPDDPDAVIECIRRHSSDAAVLPAGGRTIV